MDPLSQALVGGAVAQGICHRDQLGACLLLGGIAGAAPDLDVLIQSTTNPLLFLEYHRQFTHALIFIPVGAAVVACIVGWLFRRHLTWKQIYIVCVCAYATHGLLDACTSYGTQLLWPFSNERIAWNIISVVDPLFTLPIMGLLGVAVVKRRKLLSYLALGWAFGYLSLGAIQNHRAGQAIHVVAQHLGNVPVQVMVKPGFANLLLWKAIYESEGQYFVHGLRMGIDIMECGSARVGKLQPADLRLLPVDSQQWLDIEKFRWFSAGYLALRTPNLIVDVRYSNLPNQIEPLWGIRIQPNAQSQARVSWWRRVGVSAEERQVLVAMLAGQGCQKLEAKKSPF